MNEITPTMRRAQAHDAAAVQSLTRAAYASWVPLIGREPRPMTADHAAAIANHQVDLLLLGGELAGVIEMIRHPDHLLIENVAVAPAFQQRGFGMRLVAHAEAVGAALGHRHIRLYTNSRFAENIALYTKLGYCIDREESWSGGITVHMVKPLAPPASAVTPAALLVQRQLDAYNAKDIDRFMQCWAEDCQYFAFPAQPIVTGAAAIRERHIERFREPDLYGHLVNRIATSSMVVDQETVTRNFPEGRGDIDVVAIYEVTDGKIAKAWFRMGEPRLHRDLAAGTPGAKFS